MSFEAAVHAKAIQLDHMCLEMCAAAGSGHPTSAMSLGHIVTVLMYHTMRWLPDHPQYPTSDRLVLSEGHAVPIVYAAFADLGGAVGKDELKRLTTDDLMDLRANESPLDGHPNPMEGFPFFDAATGSLGQGLSVAAGIGAAAVQDDMDKRVYCIVGDGESREGQVTEAIDMIVDLNLRNVLPIFNCNGYGQANRVSAQQSPERLAAKLQAMGLEPIVIDGHAPEDIRGALERFVNLGEDDAPVAIVAKTVKGWGAASLQGGGWHGKPPTGERFTKAQEELNSTSVGLTSALSSDELRIYPPAEHQP
ncbi:MAG: phosphoketolase family protein, partial [Planctomycetota bacterium]